MSIKSSIENVLAEIRNYRGNFGDPIISLVDFDPLDALLSGTKENQVGSAIALLVKFVSHVDNADYESALEGEAAENIRTAINLHLCIEHEIIFKAFLAAIKSEADMQISLGEIYKKYILQSA